MSFVITAKICVITTLDDRAIAICGAGCEAVEKDGARAVNEYEMMVRRLMAEGPRRLRRELRANLPLTRMQYGDLDLMVAPSLNYTEFVLWRRGRPPEHRATQHLRGLFEGKDATIVDVGANAGIFSLPIAKGTGAGARFLLVEPNPEMVARLRANIALNGLNSVLVVESAIGEEDGRATLYFSPNRNPGEARLGVAFADDTGGIDVPVVTLPGLAARHGMAEIDLLKVDVEGLEDRVILPALADSGLTVRRIYFEDAHSEHWNADVVGALKEAGYKEEARFGENALYNLA